MRTLCSRAARGSGGNSVQQAATQQTRKHTRRRQTLYRRPAASWTAALRGTSPVLRGTPASEEHQQPHPNPHCTDIDALGAEPRRVVWRERPECRREARAMDQIHTIGDRVRDVRKRRGLSQRELADLSGASVSLIRKLEQGERQDVRMETARKLATALRVPTTTLIPHHAENSPAHADVAKQWGPVRRALAGQEPQPAEESTPKGVREAMRSLAPALTSHRYQAVQEILPALLRDADALGPEPDARKIRSDILNTTGYLLTQTRQFDIAEMTLNRAIDAASDRFDAAAAADTLLWLYLRQGRLAEARGFAASWADEDGASVLPRHGARTDHVGPVPAQYGQCSRPRRVPVTPGLRRVP